MSKNASVFDGCTHSTLRYVVISVLLLIALVCVGGWVGMHGFFHGMVAGNPGPVKSAEQWPKVLQDLVSGAKRGGIAVQGLQVECMCKGMETEYVWRMHSTAAFFDFLKARWKLSPVPRPDGGIFSGRSAFSGEKTPEWWSPLEGEKTMFYVSERLTEAARAVPEGSFGDQFQVAVDEGRHLIFVHYYEKW